MKLITWVVCCLIFLSSCATKKLYKSSSTNAYEEIVSQYYISKEGRILIIAQDNHYLLEASPELLKIAKSNLASDLELEISAMLDIDLQENIKGEIKL
ncbi:hypothetical protein OAA91_02200, partial [Fibrobacterales bacterium]|nr:hypothetical protein [Fibrobacterales bacterium]